MKNLTWTRVTAVGQAEYKADDDQFEYTIEQYAARDWVLAIHRKVDGECQSVMQGFVTLREAKADAAEYEA